MTYNIHPIFVHFPIAFLLLYSTLVLVPFRKWFPKIQWDYFRFFLLVLGIAGALVASATGETAVRFTSGARAVVEAHEFFASGTISLYITALVFEVWPFVYPRFIVQNIKNKTLEKVLNILNTTISNKTLLWLIALAGLVTLTLTGMIGGILVYGTTADPLAPLILQAIMFLN